MKEETAIKLLGLAVDLTAASLSATNASGVKFLEDVPIHKRGSVEKIFAGFISVCHKEFTELCDTQGDEN